ncbi:MAG: threonine/serine exporter family protein [Blautia sp.]|jgi:uncharacterized membrane protein YjjP (DUF1212 family)
MTEVLRTGKEIEDYHLLADTAVLAGQIMLVAGAETCRVEDTILRILKTSGFQRCDAFVVTTGITVTLEDYRYGILSLTRRIRDKEINLGNIDQVNAISRKFCSGELTLKETFHQLKHMKPVAYPEWLVNISIMLSAALFTFTLGGRFFECLVAGVNGVYFILARRLNRILHLNSFVLNMAASFFMAFTTMVIKNLGYPFLNLEPAIAGSIMALLPGVAMTNGIRDTLEGDYMSGSARVIEAFVVAASLALGIGTGMAACQMLFGTLL